MALNLYLKLQDPLNAHSRSELAYEAIDARGLRTGSSHLDIGGGTGCITELFSLDCEEGVILEPSDPKVEYGRAKRPSIKFLQGSVEHIPYPDHHFDSASALLSFHHFTDQNWPLREMTRVLVPDGRALIEELDPSTRSGRWMEMFENKVFNEGSLFHHLLRMRKCSGMRAFNTSISNAPSDPIKSRRQLPYLV